MALTKAQKAKVASGRLSDAADVMLDQTMSLIKHILMKHETAQLEVMAEMKEEIERYRAACQMALEALERGPWTEDTRIKSNQAIAKLREVLE